MKHYDVIERLLDYAPAGVLRDELGQELNSGKPNPRLVKLLEGEIKRRAFDGDMAPFDRDLISEEVEDRICESCAGSGLKRLTP